MRTNADKPFQFQLHFIFWFCYKKKKNHFESKMVFKLLEVLAWVDLSKARKIERKKLKFDLTWMNYLLLGKYTVGKVVLWDSLSVSILRLHVHPILKQPNPATTHPDAPSHPAPRFGTQQNQLQICTGMNPWAYACHRHITCWKKEKKRKNILHEDKRFDFSIFTCCLFGLICLRKLAYNFLFFFFSHKLRITRFTKSL